MNTKLIMGAGALYLAILGLAATFLPQEILAYLGKGGPRFLPLLVQLIGALYLAFAMLDWMAKDSLIGGIYNRPVAMGNFVHFMVGALALIKGVMAGQPGPVVWFLCGSYSLFALLFAVVFFTSPAKLRGQQTMEVH
jgi:hypothetical protein